MNTSRVFEYILRLSIWTNTVSFFICERVRLRTSTSEKVASVSCVRLVFSQGELTVKGGWAGVKVTPAI